MGPVAQFKKLAADRRRKRRLQPLPLQKAAEFPAQAKNSADTAHRSGRSSEKEEEELARRSRRSRSNFGEARLKTGIKRLIDG